MKRDSIHPSWDGAALLVIWHILELKHDWGSGQEAERPSASCLTSLRSDKSQNRETHSPRYHYTETVSVPRIRKYKKLTNPFNGKNVIDVKKEQTKNRYNTDEQTTKLRLQNIQSLTSKALIVNYIITEYNLDVLCLTETWLITLL